MILRHIIPCAISLFMLGTEAEGALSRARIIEMSKLLCPGQEICPSNNTLSDKFQEASICCTDCSCDPNCKEDGNCCFPDQSYPIGNDAAGAEHGRSELENSTILNYECLYPSSPQPNDTLERTRQQSFWIVSEVRNKNRLSEMQKCGSRSIAPWGSILPVSSKSTGIIYKNVICAREHGVEEQDIVVWKGVTTCGKYRLKDFTLENGYLDRNCHKQFYAPPGIVIQRKHACFSSLTDTCQEDISTKTEYDLNPSEIIEACSSGFISPYRVNNMFANVFCHLCNGFKAALGSFRCPTMSVYWNSEQRSGQSVLGLLSYNYLQGLSRGQVIKHFQRKEILACGVRETVSDPEVGNCRSIQCPLGQIRNARGECFFETVEWNNVWFILTIQLTSDKPFIIKQYFRNYSDSMKFYIPNMRLPLLNYFKISTFYYKQMSLNYTNELLITMHKPTTTTKVSYFMEVVKKIINNKWFLHSQNNSISFNARIFSEKLVFQDRISKASGDVTYQRLYEIKSGFTRLSFVHLTPLYFCETIDLAANEFNISDNGIVFSKVSNRYYYNAEYIITERPLDVSCRICLEGSGFIALDPEKSSGLSINLAKLSMVYYLFISSMLIRLVSG